MRFQESHESNCVEDSWNKKQFNKNHIKLIYRWISLWFLTKAEEGSSRIKFWAKDLIRVMNKWKLKKCNATYKLCKFSKVLNVSGVIEEIWLFSINLKSLENFQALFNYRSVKLERCENASDRSVKLLESSRLN